MRRRKSGNGRKEEDERWGEIKWGQVESEAEKKRKWEKGGGRERGEIKWRQVEKAEMGEGKNRRWGGGDFSFTKGKKCGMERIKIMFQGERRCL